MTEGRFVEYAGLTDEDLLFILESYDNEAGYDPYSEDNDPERPQLKSIMAASFRARRLLRTHLEWRGVLDDQSYDPRQDPHGTAWKAGRDNLK